MLLLLFIYERPVLDLLQAEAMSEEIVRTLASAIGLVLAVPATTAIAALTVGRSREPEILPTEIIDPDVDHATELEDTVLTRPRTTGHARPTSSVLEHRRPGPSAAIYSSGRQAAIGRRPRERKRALGDADADGREPAPLEGRLPAGRAQRHTSMALWAP